MTTAEAVTRLRSVLDESVAAFWTDTEIYSALTQGQLAVISLMTDIYLVKSRYTNEDIPVHLLPLANLVSGSLSVTQYKFTLPTKFYTDISVKYNPTGGAAEPCYKRKISSRHFDDRDNSYLTGHYYSITNTELVFEEVAAATAYYQMWYLALPDDIDATHNPAVIDTTMTYVLEYALALLLNKEKRLEEANVHYLRALEIIKEI